ncbi:MAG: NUDIX domain-containing protein [Chryseolinea sp.]
MNLKDFVLEGHRTFMPNVAVDCAVFGFHNNELKILLLKWKYIKGWSLPGGYMKHTEDAELAARRLLKERTGLDNIFLQQHHTFSGITRAKLSAQNLKMFDKILGVDVPADNWLHARTVAIGYYALVEYSKVAPQPDSFTESCEWRNIEDIPPLMFDHDEMVTHALKTLRLQLSHQPVGLNLLPLKFTIGELQSLYETLLGQPLDRGNFRKKMLSTGILKKTGERPTGKAHKTPHLYSFNKKAYAESFKSGISFP